MKVLILRFSSIGDIVLTTPIPRALKTQLGAEVHYCTKPAFRNILTNNPHIDKVFTLDGKLGDLISLLKKEHYDYVIDLHHNLRTLIMKTRLGVKSYSFDKLNWEKWLLVNFKIKKLPKIHIVDRYMATIAPLGAVLDDQDLDYFIPEKDVVDLKTLPETHRNGYISMAIGAQHSTKRLPLNRLIELCQKINQPIVLLGGKEDTEVGEKIAEHFQTAEPSKIVIYNACGKFNLNQSASLVNQSLLIFSHDTGLMHIAAALKKETYSIWGNTVPEFGMYPYRTKFTVLENKNLDCRPCSKIGHNQCPKGHFKCMKELEFDFNLI